MGPMYSGSFSEDWLVFSVLKMLLASSDFPFDQWFLSPVILKQLWESDGIFIPGKPLESLNFHLKDRRQQNRGIRVSFSVCHFILDISDQDIYIGPPCRKLSWEVIGSLEKKMQHMNWDGMFRPCQEESSLGLCSGSAICRICSTCDLQDSVPSLAPFLTHSNHATCTGSVFC